MIGGPLEYLDRKFGFRMTGDDYNVDVGVAMTPVLQNAPTRVFWLICNVGSFPVSLSFKQETPYGRGLLIPAGGGVVSMSLEEDGAIVTYPVYARASADYTTLWVYEVWQT